MIARDVCADVLLGLAVLIVAGASLGVLLMRDAYQKQPALARATTSMTSKPAHAAS